MRKNCRCKSQYVKNYIYVSVRQLFVPPLPVLQGGYAEAHLLLMKGKTQV
jgi:hypothetical protein